MDLFFEKIWCGYQNTQNLMSSSNPLKKVQKNSPKYRMGRKLLLTVIKIKKFLFCWQNGHFLWKNLMWVPKHAKFDVEFKSVEKSAKKFTQISHGPKTFAHSNKSIKIPLLLTKWTFSFKKFLSYNLLVLNRRTYIFNKVWLFTDELGHPWYDDIY